ncbi:RNA polymerase I-specific transcription initiation factor RRN3 [Eremomyces bilateralis CBS 781.70]|uniref:RNA polymerase I-specific transcription initiation factor RRN3 n=1 Tax=Eremomyces bilateralis CBS 781.70 TaxID=1392243 RepID=A0A6G1G806_9PEZI|nr:RNA polymerase I-specific transcription initiation factor RRN3 [Eremomyces bilateralis CBS 781.70]KAF1813989.1 RNA polymerase I-specific transcription initiation factor RRN3 [Eremomyces bilateralis CBS 781.70]
MPPTTLISPPPSLSPLTRPSKPSLKRKRSILPTPASQEDLLVPQPKKHRVSFNPQAHIRHIIPATRDYDDAVKGRPIIEKSLDLVRAEVRRDIERHHGGMSDGFENLTRVLSVPFGDEDCLSDAMVRRHIVALTSMVNRLEKNCSALVYAVLDMDWLGRDESFYDLYKGFLAALVSTQGGYTSGVLRKLVGFFSELPQSVGRLPKYPIVHRRELRRRVHETLKYLLSLMPAASSILSPVVRREFPKDERKPKAVTDYVSNVLKVLEYAPELKGEVIALVMGRVVKIDVQIQVDLEDFEDELGEALLDGLPKNNGVNTIDDADLSDDEESNDDDSDVGEGEPDAEQERLQDLRKAIIKMDGVLDILFTHYQRIFDKSTGFEVDDAFDSLLGQFSSNLLPTYRSRHTQFLLFRFAQTSPDLVDRFIGTCISIASDKAKSHILRFSASSYLASFVARGARIDPSTTLDIFYLLGEQTKEIRRLQERTCMGPDIQRFPVYYSLIQALLYIYCFRWRDLTTVDPVELNIYDYFDLNEDLPWGPGVHEVLRANINSRFNPLKVCHPNIVQQFAKIAGQLRFMYVHDKVENNRRVKLTRSLLLPSAKNSSLSFEQRGTALSGKVDERAFQLEAYFPFDPYRLPKSKRWVEEDYVGWQPIPGMDDDEPLLDEDDDDDDDDEEDQNQETEYADSSDEEEEDEIDDEHVDTATDASPGEP